MIVTTGGCNLNQLSVSTVKCIEVCLVETCGCEAHTTLLVCPMKVSSNKEKFDLSTSENHTQKHAWELLTKSIA